MGGWDGVFASVMTTIGGVGIYKGGMRMNGIIAKNDDAIQSTEHLKRRNTKYCHRMREVERHAASRALPPSSILRWDRAWMPEMVRGPRMQKDARRVVLWNAIGNGPYIARSVESITAESGPLTWRIKLYGRACLGVISANWKNSHDIYNAPMWVTCGNGAQDWNAFGSGLSENVNNEPEMTKCQFQRGDIVEVTFNPTTLLLTLCVEGKERWSTTRQLTGKGVEEVHPCVIVSNDRVRVMGRSGVVKQEIGYRYSVIRDQLQLQFHIFEIMQDEKSHRQDVEAEEQSVWKRVCDMQRVTRLVVEGKGKINLDDLPDMRVCQLIDALSTMNSCSVAYQILTADQITLATGPKVRPLST